jgi:hypothetical protein
MLGGSITHPEEIYLKIQMEERNLPRGCHGLRRPGRRLLKATCLPKRIHSFQQVLSR